MRCLSRAPAQSQRKPSWVATNEYYTHAVRLSDLEPSSVSATLAADSPTLHVTGKRKIESCQCEPTTVREIALPYRPRAEDIR